MPKRQLKGIVVSDKMEKTVVVRVDRIKTHPKYRKRYAVSKRYKAHDENREYKTGDNVLIEECRPISRDKKWRVLKRIKPLQKANESKEEELQEKQAEEELEKEDDNQ